MELNERLDGAKVIQVIQVDFVRGAGIEGDPIRSVTRYYSLDGGYLSENDAVG